MASIIVPKFWLMKLWPLTARSGYALLVPKIMPVEVDAYRFSPRLAARYE